MPTDKLKLVVLTGAGISAESGIKTFRDSDGLWEEYNVNDVATVNGWLKNPQLVLDFYNQRRKQLSVVEPNDAHFILKELEEYFDVQIITQNVDDLHERAGSTKILHLHGELLKICNSKKHNILSVDCNHEVKIGDIDESGSQLRPYIVWFGEDVPNIEIAKEMVKNADIVAIIGTSMQVYPAAGLLYYKKKEIPLYVINPDENKYMKFYFNTIYIQENATKGVNILKDKLLNI